VAVLRFSTVTGVLRYRGAAGWWGLSSIAYLGGVAAPSNLLSAIFFAAMAAAALLLIAKRTEAARGALLLLLTFLCHSARFRFAVPHLDRAAGAPR